MTAPTTAAPTTAATSTAAPTARAAAPTEQTAPGTPRPRRSPRRHVRVAVAVAAGVAVAVGVVAAVLGVLGAPGPHRAALLDPSVQGTYRLGDGAYVTLWGTEASPSAELAGRVTSLSATGPERYASATGETTVSVERDASGSVRGLLVEESDQPSRFARRDPLFHEEPVSFRSGDATLSGTVLLPDGAGPHPGVVLVHGAGPVGRDQTLLAASHLARRGVAALVYDKRGVGASTGSFAEATFDDLTDDALAGLAVLTSHEAVDPDRVGMHGHSQGGWIVAQAAQRSDDVAFVVAISPSGFSPADQQAWLHGSMLAARGFDGSAMAVADRVDRMLYSSLDLVDAGFMPALPRVPGFWFHALDPHLDSAALWEGVRQPVLAVWGQLDCQLPARDSADAVGDALRRAGNPDVTLAVLPDADHSLTLVGPCGHETGLASHGEMHYADGALTLPADWINARREAAPPATPAVPADAGQPADGILGWHLGPPLPAPWYGSLAAQFAALAALVIAFGTVAGGWLLAVLRRRPLTRVRHLLGTAALAGLVATVTGFAAVAEIAMLGGTHAAFLVGGPTVDGASALLGAGRLLVPSAAVLSAVAVGAALRRRPTRRRPALVTGVWQAGVVAGAAVGLLVWGAYWTLLPLG